MSLGIEQQGISDSDPYIKEPSLWSIAMPLENERKFCIHESKSVEEAFKKVAEKVLKVEQKYISIGRGFSVRVRKSAEGKSVSYSMTVKKNVSGQVVEIETRISEADFNRLWPTGFSKVCKFRYLYQGWEIDFFKDSDSNNYLAVAEIEMPAWQREPRHIPSIIKKHLLYAVPIEDKRFSNKKLGNVDYAVNLLKLIKNQEPKKKAK